MPFTIIRQDITKVKTDAIVNATNKSLLGEGGVDGAIHLAAGAKLLKECETLGGCEIGSAKITKGYKLPAKYIIHTVGPIWQGGGHGEEKQLAGCYKSCLALAKEHHLKSIAFPLISAGTYGYPREAALKIATQIIEEFLSENDMEVTLVVFDKNSFTISEKLFAEITQYIDDNYIDEKALSSRRSDLYHEVRFDVQRCEVPVAGAVVHLARADKKLSDALKHLDETFSQMLLRLIDSSGKRDSEVYKRANIDRRLFSKIRSDVNYKPSKPTAIAFAIALELNLDEAKDLLLRAGFALSRSNKFDVIVEYFIEREIYNVFEINEALFAFEQ